MAHRVYQMAFGKVYPLYVLKAEKKGRTREDVHTIIRWLTGYSEEALAAVIADDTDMESFFARAPRLNPDRTLITGVICGIRVEEVEEETMREIPLSRQTHRRTRAWQSDREDIAEMSKVRKCLHLSGLRSRTYTEPQMLDALD